EGECGGVAFHDLDVRAIEPLHQISREPGVDLHRGQAWEKFLEHVGRRAVARSELDDVITEVESADDPRDDLLPDRLAPLVTRARPLVSVVHARTIRPSTTPRSGECEREYLVGTGVDHATLVRRRTRVADRPAGE